MPLRETPLLESPRSRKLVLWTTLASLLLFAALFAHRIAAVHAASRAIAAEDARATAAANPTTPARTPVPTPVPNPVLVELFTSEGCSSCPPADALLARLLKTQPVPSADIIVLEEHVDYWDTLGWHDRFSSHQFTDRQSAYARTFNLADIYTPQMVVDGTAEFVGNDSSHALHSIAQAAHTPKPTLTLSPITLDGTRINTSVTTASPASLAKSDLYAALIQTTASTQVKSGENGGHTLNHVSIVRALQKIGSSDKLSAPLFFSFAIPKDASPSDLRVVVFAQRPGQGMVVAAASSATPPPS